MKSSQNPGPAPDRLGAFRGEWVDLCRRLPDKGLFFALLLGWFGLFQFLGNSTFGYVDTPSLFGWMYNAYSAPNSEDGHGLLIPLVVGALFWWKRKQLLALHKAPWWPGLFLVSLALLLHICGYVVQQPRLSIIALFAGVYALTGLVWGTAWLRASFFPFFLFVFCIPVGSLAESITFPMRLLVTKASVALSQVVLGIDVLRDGSQIFDPLGTFKYDVAPACSGIRSLISLLALTTIYGFLTFEATWKRLLMVVVALPLALVGNIARISAVIMTAEAFGQKAGSRVHDGAGFITFGIAIGCVMALSYWLREDRRAPAGEADLPLAERPI
jgi:exosortase